MSESPIKSGVRTSEFWLSLLVVLVIVAASVADVEIDTLELALVVMGYGGSRAAAKLLPPILPPLPPPPPPPESGE